MNTWTRTNPLRISLAGVTGWTGRALCAGILADPELRLSGAVSRSAAGRTVGEVLGLAAGSQGADVRVSAHVREALSGTDVLIDYTSSSVVKANALAALEAGVSVVIGTSGLTAADYAELEKMALARGLGVIASGNFSITAALAMRFSLMAARYLPRAEVLEYYSAGKTDLPSGTVRELVERMAPVRAAAFGGGGAPGSEPKAVSALKGPVEARGAEIAGTRVHSVRMDSFVSSFEVLFGLPNEKLVLKHDSGSGADPYVAGTLLAARRAPSTKGLLRGLDNLLFGPLS